MPPSVDLESLLPTRQSLLTRLKDWEDQEGWREFFDLYWRLIYAVARRAGLSDSEAQDVVQETLVVVVKQMPRFQYDPSRGSFKSWLHTVIRGRLSRHWRKASGPAAPQTASMDDSTGGEEIVGVGAGVPEFDAIWQSEWEQNLLDAALRQVQGLVSPKQFLIFSLAVLKEVPLGVIRERYDVNLAQIYLAKHRVGKLVKAELARLRASSEK
ncbi:MAG TPA: sigma-70 family RNA polymerase sigma factor [Candidatus Limnocylindria bacterium]|nr:sigma-70 family RNA polymerase sigma factor [Candidatus Limnocylindria bacterium]